MEGAVKDWVAEQCQDVLQGAVLAEVELPLVVQVVLSVEIPRGFS